MSQFIQYSISTDKSHVFLSPPEQIVSGQDALGIRSHLILAGILLILPFWAFVNDINTEESLIVLTALQCFFRFIAADLAHRRELSGGGHTCADTVLYHIAEDCQG